MLRAARGAITINRSINLRVANRNHNTPDNHNQNVGFRLATHPACLARCRTVTAPAVQDGHAITRGGPAPVPVAPSGTATAFRAAPGLVGQANVPVQHIRAQRTHIVRKSDDDTT